MGSIVVSMGFGVFLNMLIDIVFYNNTLIKFFRNVLLHISIHSYISK